MSQRTPLVSAPKIPRILIACTVLAALVLNTAWGADSMDQTRDTFSDTWTAVDALGRTLPGYEQCGPPREGKVVGIFYFLWLGAHSKHVYDITKILEQDPDNPPWGPVNAFHFWGEPQFGYYQSNDDWVIRRHAQMLTDAGVDVLFCDVTNAVTYDENYLTLCRVLSEVRKTGRAVPQIAFLTNSSSGRVTQHLYDAFYSKNLYPELWFRWQGKPVILAKPEELTDELKDFFTVRQSWAWTDPNGWFGDGKDKWPWLDHHPQNPGWHESPDKPEQLAVCSAQHPVSNIGRSFHGGKQPPADTITPEQGLCFVEQWERALQIDPELVFVTGWNEWVAQRFIKPDKGGPGQIAGQPLKPGDSYFVDQFNQEFSRDIEPMRGGHADSYYYQMVSYIRRFKGVRPTPEPSTPKTIAISDDFTQWQDVGPEYLDDAADTSRRDHPGWEGAGTYVNETGRNDFETLKVARDANCLFFYARTREPITAPDDSNWMTLLLDVDGDPHNGWEGFDFAINRKRKDASSALVERNAGGWNWEPAGEAQLTVSGNELHLAVPRALLGLAGKALRIEFKWADNVPSDGDIANWLGNGDTAPNGRFRYVYAE